jgi:DNA-binding NarL/FixJ family response regulator
MHDPADERDMGGRPRRAVRVAVVSDRPLVVQALVFGLRTRGVQAHVVGSGWLARFLSEADGRTIVVVDTTMWSPPWFVTVESVHAHNRRRRGPVRAHLLALCDADDGATVTEALAHGADDAVAFSQSLENLCARIQLAAAPDETGGSRVAPVPREPAQPDGMAVEGRQSADNATALTPRERELLRMVADGHTPSDIAAVLHLSVLTVRTHLQRARTKLGVHSTVAAAALASRWPDLRSGPTRSPHAVMPPDRHGRASA